MFGIIGSKEKVCNENIQVALDLMQTRGGKRYQIIVNNNSGVGTASIDGISDGIITFNKDQTIWIGLDGVVFNLSELAKKYELNSYSGFKLLIDLYTILGIDFICQLNGNFSIAICDLNKQITILAKDNIGSKPLFYIINDRALIFASCMTAITRSNNIKKRFDYKAVDDFLSCSYIPEERTLIREISQVRHGQYCIFKNGELIKKQVYLSDLPPIFQRGKLAVWVEQFQDILSKSIKRRLNISKNVGFLLSGGTDTAALIGVASSFSTQPVSTFTLCFSDCPSVNESKAAKKTASYFNTNHLEIEIDGSCIDFFQEAVEKSNTPACNPCSLISYYLFKKISPYIDVVIAGDGGNDIFGGHYRYNQVMNYIRNFDLGLVGWVAQKFGRSIYHDLKGTFAGSFVDKIARTYFAHIGHAFGDDKIIELNKHQFDLAVKYYNDADSLWRNSEKVLLCTLSFRESINSHEPSEFVKGLFDYEKDVHLLQQLSYVRINSFLPYNIIPYVEYNAIANGVFSLFPLLDNELIYFMYRIPFPYVFGKSIRYFMEHSLSKNIIPKEVFKRSQKGFRAPVEKWMKTAKWREIVQDYLSEHSIKRRGWFNPSYVQNLINEYYSGTTYIKDELGNVSSLSNLIWSLAALEAWCQNQKIT